MSQGAGGFVLVLNAGRHRALSDEMWRSGRFSEPVADFSFSRSRPLVCFVVKSGRITHVALAHRGIRAGTGLARLNLVDIEELDVSISLKSVRSRIPSRLSRSIGTRLRKGGLLTEKGFDAVTEAITTIAPGISRTLDRFSSARRQRISRMSEKRSESLALQKETVATAMKLAGIDREELQGWDFENEETITSYLDGLEQVRLREDPMITHDESVFPGHELVRRSLSGSTVFHGEGVTLTVLIANRLPLEEQTGADLIYLNETYRCFVLVQYKAMEKRNRSGRPDQSVYRLPNSQLEVEIERMERLYELLGQVQPNPTDHHDYRLSDNPFFLKLCPRLVFDPDSISLTPGMYLPLDYWKAIEVSPRTIGSRGGRMVTFENVARYLDNSAFATMVSGGWIGTRPWQSDVLAEVVREVLESGKAVTIAIRSPTPIHDDIPEGEPEAA